MEAMTNIPATGHAFEGNFLNRPVGFSPSVVKSRTLPHDAENSPALCFYGSPRGHACSRMEYLPLLHRIQPRDRLPAGIAPRVALHGQYHPDGPCWIHVQGAFAEATFQRSLTKRGQIRANPRKHGLRLRVPKAAVKLHDPRIPSFVDHEAHIKEAAV